MAHAKNHDYHVLPPSIWPFFGALAGFVMLFGSVLWMKGSAPWMFLIGLAGVLYVMFAWWSEVVHESQAGDHTPVVRLGLKYGFILFIMSEVMFFSAWFWTFFKHRLYPMGPNSPAVDGVWALHPRTACGFRGGGLVLALCRRGLAVPVRQCLCLGSGLIPVP